MGNIWLLHHWAVPAICLFSGSLVSSLPSLPPVAAWCNSLHTHAPSPVSFLYFSVISFMFRRRPILGYEQVRDNFSCTECKPHRRKNMVALEVALPRWRHRCGGCLGRGIASVLRLGTDHGSESGNHYRQLM